MTTNRVVTSVKGYRYLRVGKVTSNIKGGKNKLDCEDRVGSRLRIGAGKSKN